MATLTDRYVDAAMRSVPERQRADIAAELRAAIDRRLRFAADRDEFRGEVRIIIKDGGVL